MAFLHCEIASESLRMATAVDVILPDKGDLSEVKTLYLLHGLTDDCTGWTRYTAVERYAREHGLAVVLPEVQRSFYTDMACRISPMSPRSCPPCAAGCSALARRGSRIIFSAFPWAGTAQ